MTTRTRARRNGRQNVNGARLGRPQRPTQVMLGPGLSLWNGLTSEEYLTSLKPWSRAVKVYQEMQDDVVIGALFESIKTPLIASPFEVVVAEMDTEEDRIAADFLRANTIDNANFEWISHVDEMMEYIDMGFSIAEKVLEKGDDGLLYIRDLIPIGQDTLHRWGPLDEFGKVTGFIQRDKPSGKIRAADMEKLLHFTFRGRKRNPEGRGILRSLYRPWFFKKNLEALETSL